MDIIDQAKEVVSEAVESVSEMTSDAASGVTEKTSDLVEDAGREGAEAGNS